MINIRERNETLQNPADFSDRIHFPGSSGTPLDVVIRGMERLQRIPSWLLAILLYILALIPAHGNYLGAFALWFFFIVDWLLLFFLPSAGKSFGPEKPPVILLAILRTIFAFIPMPVMGVFQIIGTFLVIYAFWMEPHTLSVARQKLTSNFLPEGFRMKILHVGDLHMERITDRERQLNRLIKELKPDLLLFSGDFLNISYLQDVQAKEGVRSLIMEWQATYGVFGVTGSPAVDLMENSPALYEGLPIRMLSDEVAEVDIDGQRINLIGLTCSQKPFIDAPKLSCIVEKMPSAFTILLHHTPDLAPQAAIMKNPQGKTIDLQLSGHTHGGQVRLPFYGAIFAGSLYGKKFEAGRYILDTTTLYVTRGVGMEGAGAPRARFFCPPEIILWEVSGEGS